MAEFDTITITDSYGSSCTIRRPDNFSPTFEDVYSNEYVTMTGDVKADRIGWKFADMELKWAALSENEVLSLMTSIHGNVFTISVDTAYNRIFEEKARAISQTQIRHRYKQNGQYYWKDVSVKISFLKTHSFSA